jgi:exopolysaccharide biosynthesis polyprenyl glycosylphosphotransferase
MSAPAIHIGAYNRLTVDSASSKSIRLPRHAPDVLQLLYNILRPTPPLLALSSFWIQTQWSSGQSLLNAHSLTLRHVLLTLSILQVWNVFASIPRAPSRECSRSWFLFSELSHVAFATGACALLSWLGKHFFGFFNLSSFSVSSFAIRCGGTGALVVLLAAVSYSAAYYLSRPEVSLIIGSRYRAIRIYKTLMRQKRNRSMVLGFIDPDCAHQQYLPCDYLGTIEALESILVRNPVDRVYLALPLRSHYNQVQDAIRICEQIGVDYLLQSDLFDTRLAKQEGFVHRAIHDDYHVLLKRAVDIAAAGFLLLAFSPLLVVISIAIKLTSSGPVFFVQERYGRNRRRFRIYKFRSMVINAESLMPSVESLNEATGPIFKIKRDPRITRVGALLRKSSLDELPQLLNVLKGEMSLVGPRPMSLRDVHRFSESSLMRRFSVTPGITGLWQVSGRSNTDFDTWMALDLQYIDHWSLGLDLRILLLTFPAVLMGSGAA